MDAPTVTSLLYHYQVIGLDEVMDFPDVLGAGSRDAGGRALP